MRKTVLWKSPHVRVSLSALLALLAVFAFSGCGGGGGGGGNNNNNGGNNGGGNNPPPGQNATLAFITGRVVDTSSTPKGVPNATVTVVGTNISAKTASDGSFTLANVPLTATQFTVISPDTFQWYNFASYNAKQYDTINCRLPLPNLQAGQNILSGTVVLYSAGNNPPPPPPVNGCP